jgi:purine catabolism regulator
MSGSGVLTVRELLADLNVTVRSGEAGLDAPVRWVHISELRDPTPWLSGGELLLTTGLALDTPAAQREFVSLLADRQVAGVGFGVGFGHDKAPKALVESARERDLPLFEVPYELPFIAVTEKAFTRLVNEQYAILQRALAAHERLERIVLSERGLDAIATALATLTGGAAIVFDPRGEPLARSEFRRPLGPDAVAGLRDEILQRSRGQRPGFTPAHPDFADRALALPVAATGEPRREDAAPQAWIVAVKDVGPLTEFDRLVLHQAVTIVALELLRRRVASDTERRLAGDVLAQLIAGELDGDELARRLAPFGLRDRVAALVVAPGADGAQALGAAERGLADALAGECAPALVAAHGTLAAAFVPAPSGDDDAELVALATRVSERMRSNGTPSARLGVGRGVGAGDARRTFHEARCALEARLLANGSGGGTHGPPEGHDPAAVATYHDLGSFQLLLALQDEAALRLFCDSILGPIEAGEGHYGGELLRSLEAFIECNGQWERAAKQLYCHRHTLRYRVRKIEELTGRDLANARDRIDFWLALRGRELMT